MWGYSGGPEETKLLVGLFAVCGALHFLGVSHDIIGGILIGGLAICWLASRYFARKNKQEDDCSDSQ